MEKYIGLISKEAQYFVDNIHPSRKQVDSFGKIIDLFPDPNLRDSASARSRRRTAHSLLKTVLQDVGLGAFLLCSFALSITALAEVKSHDLFLQGIRNWLTSNPVPANFSVVTREYEARYEDRLPSTRTSAGGRATALGKRGHDDISPDEERPSVMRPAKRSVGDRAGTPRSNDSDELGEAWDLSDEGEGEDFDEEVEQPLVDAPLAGKVYTLKNIDAITVLATAKEELGVHLTMPDHPDVKPFITFRCSERSAMRYLTKRYQVM